MALINHRTREIHFKIVYYGPGLCGKTTNLKALHDRLPPERRGRMISIATDNERTLFFDFLPIDLGQVNGFTTRFHLYTVPGQVYYKLSRRAVLQGVDGIIFVADSHPSREYANRDSLADLFEHMRTLNLTGATAARIPWVFQWNKRDAEHAIPVERLQAVLNPNGAPAFEAVASDGRGVSETLRAACKAVLARLATTGELHAGAPAAALAAAASAPVPAPAAPAPAVAPPPAPAHAAPVFAGAPAAAAVAAQFAAARQAPVPAAPARQAPPPAVPFAMPAARMAPAAPSVSARPSAPAEPPALTHAAPVATAAPIATEPADAAPAKAAPPAAAPRRVIPSRSRPAASAGAAPRTPTVRRVVPTSPSPSAPSGPVRIVPRAPKPRP